MSESEEFEEVKKLIRSVLLPFQNGCSLSKFREEYQLLIGPVPFKKFNYYSENEFLRDMPDVVSVRNNMLYAVADDSTKHIQKMVGRQKSSKQKTRPAPHKRTTGYMAPRFQSYKSSYYYHNDSSTSWNNYNSQRSYPEPGRLPPYNHPSTFPQKPSYQPYHSSQQQRCYKQEPVQNISNSNILPNKDLGKELLNSLCHNDTSKRPLNLMPQNDSSKPGVIGGRQTESVQNLPDTSNSNFLPNKDTNEELRNILSHIDTSKRPLNLISHNNSSKPSVTRDMQTAKSNFHLQSHNGHIQLNTPELYRAHNSNIVEMSKSQMSYSEILQQTSNNSFQLKKSSISPSKPAPDNFFSNTAEQLSANNNRVSPSKPAPDYFFSNTSEQLSANNNRGFLSAANKNFSTSDLLNQESVYSRDPPIYSFKSSKLDCLDGFDLPAPKEMPMNRSGKLRENLQKITSIYPQGIYATDFPHTFKDMTGHDFDLHNLGFSDLSSFVDSFPDLLLRRNVVGSRKDWLVCPAQPGDPSDSSYKEPTAFAVERIILNTRNILTAYEPEGIRLQDFLHAYSINCNEPLYVQDLGFDSIENFLMSIAERVPLKFIAVAEGKWIRLGEFRVPDVVSLSKCDSEKLNELALDDSLPPSVLPLDTGLPALDLDQFDFSQYILVYTSTVLSPTHLYLQMVGEDTSDAMKVVNSDMEKFYSGPRSPNFKIKKNHVKKGVICAALWPRDQHWYRAKILSVVSPNNVVVSYVDYGTKDTIPTSMLRYLKLIYSKLPVQAVRASLAFVKPAQGPAWDPNATSMILDMCMDNLLMCKVDDNKNGVLSVILCDTSTSEEDVFINDALIKNGFATHLDSSVDEEEVEECIPPPVMGKVPDKATSPGMPDPGLAESVAQFSRLPPPKFGSGSATVPRREEPILETLKHAQTTGLAQYYYQMAIALSRQTQQMGFDSSSFVPAPSSFLPPELSFPPPPPGFQQPLAAPKAPSPPQRKESPTENVVFDETDDALFDEFYEKATIVTKRYVKRVCSADNYVFHILIIDRELHVSDGDISHLIWSDKKDDYLKKRLENRDIVLPSRLLSEVGNEAMFEQFKSFYVKGITTGRTPSFILVYSLKSMVKILNEFGHPSAELRRTIQREIADFDPQHPSWQELSDAELSERGEEPRRETDDAKLDKICMYDLCTMRDSIRNSRMKLARNPARTPENEAELRKLSCFYDKIVDRIYAIQLVCDSFADHSS